MSVGLQQFRGLEGSRFVTVQNAGETGVQKGSLSVLDRLKASWNGGSLRHGLESHQTENKNFKAAFYQALVKAEGPDVARAAVKAAGLPPDWRERPNAMSGERCARVLDAAQHIRMNAIVSTNRSAREFSADTGPSSLTTVLRDADAGAGRPPGAQPSRALQALFLRETRRDPMYGKRELGYGDFERIAQTAVAKFYTAQEGRFAEAHPGLRSYQQAYPATVSLVSKDSVVDALKTQLATPDSRGQGLCTESTYFRNVAFEALNEVGSNDALLGRMSYDPAGCAALRTDLRAKFDALDGLQNALTAMNVPLNFDDAPQTQEGQDLQHGLLLEVRHQMDLLTAKMSFVDDVMDKDPLSTRAVAYSNLLWAEAAGHIYEQARALTPTVITDGTHQQVDADLNFLKHRDILQAKNDYDYAVASPAARTVDPATISKDQHPATLAKDRAITTVRRELAEANFPPDVIDRLTSKENVSAARRQALNQNQTWAACTRSMIVNKDGVTRTYRSVITPGPNISPRFQRTHPTVVQLDGTTTRAGVSSAEKADTYHARNLKVSELQRVGANNQVETVAKVIGHGVLDMWDVPDAQDRMDANDRGAREVLEAALTTNTRVLATAVANAQAPGGPGQPVTLTHVSVNLVTPSPMRELGILKAIPKLEKKVHDYQELTYTKEQFRAFEANSSGPTGAPKTLTVADPTNGANDVDVSVKIDTIAFSFAINPLATGTIGENAKWVKGPLGDNLLPEFASGWKAVHADNERAMVAFVGDLGTDRFGAFGSRPGGFIGSIHDRLDENDRGQSELAGRIREQTNTVRALFTTEAFKRGDGDPAKMSREILSLQAMAEEALALMKVMDQAATMSKGCKSDKDRGGVTDVEFKHKLITEEMGGRIVPNEALDGDDQENYYVVAAASTQIENQQLNTGLPGSKEAGKLKQRIPSPQVRQYLAGLGALAAE